MKRHLVTAAILMLALVLYALGFSGLGTAAIAAGAVFELWFWIRIVRGRHPTPPTGEARASQ